MFLYFTKLKLFNLLDTKIHDIDTDSMDSSDPLSSTSSLSQMRYQTLNTTDFLQSQRKDEQLFQIKNRRYHLFNRLVEFLPENLVQPKGNLSDLILY